MKNLGLPKNILYCKKCVISNQRPSSTVEFKSKKTKKKDTIFFDKEGICDACNFNKIKSTINWSQRDKDLEKLLKKFRKSNGEYDVIVPGSGGKDSAFTSHILKYKYGMNPLTVTWSPHLYTDIGWKNFENWSKIGGLDNILFTPNGRLHSYLTQQSFLNLLHPFQPFILGQRIIGPLFASKYNVKLVMYGENQAEYGNKSAENKNPKMNDAFFTIKNNDMITLGGKTIKNIINNTEFKIQDFQPYIPLKKDYILKKKIEVHYLGYYLKWDPQECYYYASENTGFQANEERTEGTYSKYSSIDDKIDMFHYYTTLIKFGIGRATYDASQEIRNNKITRDEGISLVKKYDQEFPERYFKGFLNYIQIDKNKFFKTIDQYRSNHIWIKKRNKWKLKNPIWNEKKF